MKRILLALMMVSVLSLPAWAGIFQGNLSSAQTCGMGHFELGAYGTWFPEKVFGKAGGFVGGKVTFGLLDSLDIGARYAMVPVKIGGFQPTLLGAEVRFRLINEDLIWPTLSIYGDYYKITSGLEMVGTQYEVSINDYGGGLTISKSLGPIVPFGSLSYRFGSVTFGGQQSDIFNINDLLGSVLLSAGVEFNLFIFQAVAEANFIRDIVIYSAGLNLKI